MTFGVVAGVDRRRKGLKSSANGILGDNCAADMQDRPPVDSLYCQ